MSEGQALKQKIWGACRGLPTPWGLRETRGGWGWGVRRQHCLNADRNSAYRIALTVGAAVDVDWVAPGGDESSFLGGSYTVTGLEVFEEWLSRL